MFRKALTQIGRAAAIATLLSATAFAQAGISDIQGTVKVKSPQGLKIVTGATVDIYRLDIKGHWDSKTDKNGHFIRVGMSFVGTYLVVVSGPGLTPTWVNNVHLASSDIVDVECSPGDGATLTLEEVQKQIAGQKGGVTAPPSQSTAESKAKAEAAAKAAKEVEAKNEETKATYNSALAHFKQGVALKQQKDYQGAIAEFLQAATIDPTKQAAFAEVAYKSNANAAQTNYQLGVDLFNEKKRDDAKPHFEGAVDQITKAISIINASADKDKTPAVKEELIVYYDVLAKNVKLLVQYYGEANRIDDMVKALDQVEALDATNKTKWGDVRGDLYFSAGQTDQAAATYKGVLAADPNNLDALYGIGLTLVASTDKATLQEAANYLSDFIAKAPAADKRVPEVKSALDALKAANNVEAEKPSKRKKGGQ
jgi:tetratricopeptide (TPR) repeat protein